MDSMEPIGPESGSPDPAIWRRRPSKEVVETGEFIERARRAALSGASEEAIGWYERTAPARSWRT